MRKSLSTFLALICATPVFCQDLLLIDDKDSIECNILSYGKRYFSFEMIQEDEIVLTAIDEDRVTNYWFDFFEKSLAEKLQEKRLAELTQSEVIDDNESSDSSTYNQESFSVKDKAPLIKTASGKPLTETPTYSSLNIVISGGYVYRLSKTPLPPGLEDYAKQIRRGFNFGINLTKYFGEYWGIGLHYQRFGFTGTGTAIVTLTPGTLSQVEVSSNINVDYYALSLTTRYIYSKGRQNLLLRTTFGYSTYLDRATIGADINISAATFAYGTDLIYNIALNKSIMLNATFGLFGAEFKDAEVTLGESIIKMNNTAESLYNLQGNLGFTFRF